MKQTREYGEIRKLMNELGSNFDYIFDTLNAINIGIKRGDKLYTEQKLEMLIVAANAIAHDVPIGMRRRGDW